LLDYLDERIAMTVFRDELENFVGATFRAAWTRRAGRVVPDVDSLPLKNEAVTFEAATVLYADLAESTALVKGYKDFFAAEIYKNYLYCATRIIARTGGVVTAYDGDRVMAVFLGDTKNPDAAKCALHINYAVTQIIQPAIKVQWPDEKYEVRQKVGIDTSSLFVAKTGARGTNDLVWVGNAANNAAKMAGLSLGYKTYISAPVYNMLLDSSKFAAKVNMWTNLGTSALGYQIYGSNYRWDV
jgi:class 3 adenylate cyclase